MLARSGQLFVVGCDLVEVSEDSDEFLLDDVNLCEIVLISSIFFAEFQPARLVYPKQAHEQLGVEPVHDEERNDGDSQLNVPEKRPHLALDVKSSARELGGIHGDLLYAAVNRWSAALALLEV